MFEPRYLGSCPSRGTLLSEGSGWLMPRAAVLIWLVVQGCGLVWPAQAQDWPQWRGPNRDSVSTETGLLKKWPEGGPRLLWMARGCGSGYSTVSIADGLIYTTGDIGNECFVVAFDLDGNLKWKTPSGKTWTKEYPGARSIPTVHGGMVYALNGHGRLIGLDAGTGKSIWSRNVVSDFGGKVIRWGLAESVLIDGNNVICTPGGKDACMVALDKRTGKTVWTSKGASYMAGHASPIICEFGGVRQIVNLTRNGLVAVIARTGEFLWHYGPRSSDWHVLTPIYSDGGVFFVGPYGIATKITLAAQGNKIAASRAWEVRMQNHHGALVLVNGYLYGHDKDGWCCLDFETGKRMWFAKGIGKGSLTCAQGMLYCLNERGTVALVRASPKGYDSVSQFQIPAGGSGPTWAHPVVCEGHLYVRHADYLYAFDIKARG